MPTRTARGIGRPLLHHNEISTGVASNRNSEFLQAVRKAGEVANVPVSFYAKVVDQDGDALQNVTVELAVIEQWSKHLPDVNSKTTPLERQTDIEGRFEVSGLKGKYVAVYTLTKTGYEQEFPGQPCGVFGPQSTSPEKPAVLKLWRANMHEPLIAGEKSFDLVPDGRRYSIDLMKLEIAEGEAGDLVVWIKRPESVQRGERFGWSCGLAVPDSGLLESQSHTMFIAPERGYTNPFTFQEQEGQQGFRLLARQAFLPPVAQRADVRANRYQLLPQLLSDKVRRLGSPLLCNQSFGLALVTLRNQTLRARCCMSLLVSRQSRSLGWAM